MAIAQTQTEQTSSPTITPFTIQCACQNKLNSERSEEVSGRADCATSAGFMSSSFRLLVLPGAARDANGRRCQTGERTVRSRLSASTRHVRKPNDVPPPGPESPIKLV